MIEMKSNYYSLAGFSDICHVLYRNKERFGLSAFIILCKLSAGDSKDQEWKDSCEMQEVIRQSVRNQDAFTKYSNTQFLILVMGGKAECDEVCSTIQKNLDQEGGKKINVEFSCSSLESLKPTK